MSKKKFKPPEPYGFQGIGIYRMQYRHKGLSLNADDMGLGKTMQAILASVSFRRKRPIIVVCPSPVKYQWESQVKLFTGLRCWVVEGLKPPKRMPLDIPEVIIINWEILKAWWKKLKALGAKVIIGDEIHYIKNRNAKRTKCFVKLARPIQYKFFLSGTPIENGPAEFFVILNLLRPDLFPNFITFADRYCDPQYTPWGISYKGATRTKELNRLLKKHLMVRRTTKQVMKDLPKLRRTVVPLKVSLREYKQAEKDILSWLYKHRPSKAKKAKRALHLTKMNYLLSMVSEIKFKEVIKWIDNFLATTNRKLAVYGHHRDFLTKLYKHYKKNSVIVLGGAGHKRKTKAVDAFVHDKKIRLIFASLTAMGTGVDGLQKACSDMAIVELIWVGLKLLQVEKRIHRIGQARRVMINYLIALSTIEESVCRAIFRKQKDVNKIIDGRYGKQEFSIFNSVIKDLEKKGKRRVA